MFGTYIHSKGHAHVTDALEGLEVLDIHNPSDPIEIGRFYDGGTCYDIKVVDNIAYIADRHDGLEVLQISITEIDHSNISGVEFSYIIIGLLLILPILKNRK